MDDDDSEQDYAVGPITIDRNEVNGPPRIVNVDNWNKDILSKCHVTKDRLNALVMDYFVIEGFKKCSEWFEKESNTQVTISLVSINDRVEIRRMISQGLIKDAIQLISETVPELLNSDRRLLFRLHQQQFIESLRQNDVATALSVAETAFLPALINSLTDLTDQHISIHDIESTMTLLIFPSPKDSPMAHFFDYERRQQLAGEANSAILLCQCQRSDSELKHLLRRLVVAQEDLSTRLVTFPSICDIST